MVEVKHKRDNLFTVEGACVAIDFLVLGMIENNTYIISDGNTTFVVDPSSQSDQIIEALEGKKLDYIFLTHCHYDHIGAASELCEATGAKVISSAVDADSIESPDARSGRMTVAACPVDEKLEDGEVFEMGNMQWKSILTPGHTKGGMCWYLSAEYGSNKQGMSVLLSGDILFHGTIGRTDFVDGSMDDMRESLKKLTQLPDETLVLPGHNDLTTIADERGRTLERMINQ